MNALLHVDLNVGMPSVCVLLSIERLDVAFAGLVGVIDNPRLPALAAIRLPDAFADCHSFPLAFFRFSRTE